jgi:endonuclease/exonuclease/phosphatase family metal-dependent hydrolase
MTVRIASYNIHKCLGFDRRRRPDRTLAVLSALKADVLALQEVDHRLGSRPAALCRKRAEGSTGLVALPFALGPHSLGWHGQVILIRPDYRLHDLRRIELPGLEPRGAVMAEVETGVGPLRIIGLHLGLIRRFRRMQLAAISAFLSHRDPWPTILIGDFNEWSPRGGAETLGGAFHIHAPGPSFPATRPIARLDRIATGPGVHLIDAGVHDGRFAALASDHLPIWADVRL